MISVGLLTVQDSCYIALSVSFVVDIYIVSSSHVVILLSKTYPQCKIISFEQSLPSYKFICGNICSSDLVNYAFQEEEIDIVVHFDAQTHVDNSFGNSFQFSKTTLWYIRAF
jgi:dTDP-D-glucose 4,6-dehydratase